MVNFWPESFHIYIHLFSKTLSNKISSKAYLSVSLYLSSDNDQQLTYNEISN